MKFNEAAFAARAQVFLAEYLAKHNIQKVVIGLSGGIDSAVAINLAVRAIGAENVIAVMLPNGKRGDEACGHARTVAQKLGIIPISRDIGPIVRIIAAVNSCEHPRRLGNLAARARMVVLYDIAAAEGAIVLGTENKTEHYLGYFTKAGDEVADIELIRDLYKTQVRALARYLGVPQVIIDKPPTADLWEGQTDEMELGVTYEMADKVLAGLEAGWSTEEFKAAEVCCAAVILVQDRMGAIAFKLQDTPYPLLATE